MSKAIAKLALAAVVLVLAIILAFVAGRDSADDQSTSPTPTPAPTATETATDSGSADGGTPGSTPDAPTAVATEVPATTPATALPPGDDGCGMEVYTLSLPADWHHDPSCRLFSRQPLAAAAALTEVDMAWTFQETYDQAVARVGGTPDTWLVTASLERTVAGRQARWLSVTLGPDAGRSGRQHLVLVDLDGGVLFLAASSEAPDGAQPIDFITNSAAMETIIASLVINDPDTG
jgi:hypothetical protein